jgi:hypothetical protein
VLVRTAVAVIGAGAAVHVIWTLRARDLVVSAAAITGVVPDHRPIASAGAGDAVIASAARGGRAVVVPNRAFGPNVRVTAAVT